MCVAVAALRRVDLNVCVHYINSADALIKGDLQVRRIEEQSSDYAGRVCTFRTDAFEQFLKTIITNERYGARQRKKYQSVIYIHGE